MVDNLNFEKYLELKNNNVSDRQIQKKYNIPYYELKYFVKKHYKYMQTIYIKNIGKRE